MSGATEPREPLPWLRLDPRMLCSDESVGALSFTALGLHAALIEPAWFGDGLPEDPSTLLPVRARGIDDYRRAWVEITHLWPLGADERRRNPWLEQQRQLSLTIRERKRKNRRGGKQNDNRGSTVERPSNDRATGGCLQTDPPTHSTDGTDQPTNTRAHAPEDAGRDQSSADGVGGEGPETFAALLERWLPGLTPKATKNREHPDVPELLRILRAETGILSASPSRDQELLGAALTAAGRLSPTDLRRLIERSRRPGIRDRDGWLRTVLQNESWDSELAQANRGRA